MWTRNPWRGVKDVDTATSRQHRVYLVENLLNGKKYVGITRASLARRLLQHSQANSPLGMDLREHGKQAFAARVLLLADDVHTAALVEARLIRHYGTARHGYNVSPGRAGSLRSNNISQETAEAIVLLRNRGYSCAKLARVFGVHRSTVERVLADYPGFVIKHVQRDIVREMRWQPNLF